MNGDPNSARDDVLGALSLLEATITGMADGPDKLRLAFASSALRRANEKLRACKACDGYGCDVCPEPDTFSRKVPDTPGLRLVGAFQCDPDPSCGQAS